jgi:hypothetical protein
VLSITLDCGLNLLWLAISVFALVRLGSRDWRRSFTVFLATLALFPIVSDSDDLFSFAQMRIPVPHHRNAGTMPEDSREKDTMQLARVLEILEHSQAASPYVFALALLFVVMLLALDCAAFTRPVLASSGRAPPLA